MFLPSPRSTIVHGIGRIIVAIVLLIGTKSLLQAQYGYGEGIYPGGHVGGGTGISYGFGYSSIENSGHGHRGFGVGPSLGHSYYGVGPSLNYSDFGVGPSLRYSNPGYAELGDVRRHLYVAPTYDYSSTRALGGSYQTPSTRQYITPGYSSMKAPLPSRVPQNVDRTPMGELRPGMVLPDGAIVISVGQAQAPPRPTR